MIDVKKFNRRVMLSLIGFVALGLALPALAAACGSDPDPEVQTRPDAEVQDPPDAGVQVRGYIDTIAPIFENARAGSRAVDASFPRPGDQREGEDRTPWYAATIEWQERLVGALGGVDNPPADLKEAHRDYVAVVSELLELNRKVRDQLANGESDFNSDIALDPELGLKPQDTLWGREAKACGNLKFLSRKTVPNADFKCSYRPSGM